jgi:hypothetical protein
MVLEPRAILSIIALTKKNHPGKTISCFCQKEQKHSLDKIDITKYFICNILCYSCLFVLELNNNNT